MTLEPSSFQTLSRVERVMNAIKERLASRALAAGAKLPSIRRFAASQQVSKSTVVEAYERLVAEGIIQSRPGSGFYVTHHLPPLALAELGPKLDREVDPFWISRQSLEAKDDFLKPGCGWLPASWMPQEEVRRALRFLARAQPSSLADYGTPLGFAPLRQLLANRLERYHIEASANQILLTESGTQAIDFLCRFLLEPGDVVLVDDPCYFNFNALLRVHRVKVVSVAYTPHGPDLAAFETALKTHNPRLYITNSAFHNPTGATLSPAVAHRLLKLAEASNLIIIEDDIFADFEHQPSPRLAAFDHFERVIYIGSFTKTISAAARCGFIVARADWIDGLIDLKIATSFGGDGLVHSDFPTLVLADNPARQNLANIFVSFSPDLRKLPSAKAAMERLKGAQINPAGFVLRGYSALEILAQSLQKAENQDFANLNQTLNNNEFDTPLGKIRFDTKGDANMIDYAIHRWERDTIIAVN